MKSQIEDLNLSDGSGQFAILRGLIAAKQQLRPRMLIVQSLSRRWRVEETQRMSDPMYTSIFWLLRREGC